MLAESEGNMIFNLSALTRKLKTIEHGIKPGETGMVLLHYTFSRCSSELEGNSSISSSFKIYILGGIGSVGGRCKREGICGYMYTYS